MTSVGTAEACVQGLLQLNINSPAELGEFLKTILPEFLRVVNPRESGLLDKLLAADLLTETDHESLSGKDVKIRKDQARKLWFRLNKMSVEDFMMTVAPELLKDFPHIIPERFLAVKTEDSTKPKQAPDEDCLRHAIMGRIRETTMADLLYHQNCLSLEDYEDIASETFDSDIVWMKMLDSCTEQDQGGNHQLVDAIQGLLKRYKVHVPANLQVLVSRGIPCTCTGGHVTPPKSPVFARRKVGSWLRKNRVCPNPRSSGSSSTRVDLRSYNGGTSVRDDDMPSLISSENTHVPDHVTICPVTRPSSHIASSVAALPKETETNSDENEGEKAVDDECLPQIEDDVAVCMVVSESTDLGKPKPRRSLPSSVNIVSREGHNAAMSHDKACKDDESCHSDAVGESSLPQGSRRFRNGAARVGANDLSQVVGRVHRFSIVLLLFTVLLLSIAVFFNSMGL